MLQGCYFYIGGNAAGVLLSTIVYTGNAHGVSLFTQGNVPRVLCSTTVYTQGNALGV